MDSNTPGKAFKGTVQVKSFNGRLQLVFSDPSTLAFRGISCLASYRNREYRQLFGAPPMRDVERLREVARETARL